MNILSNITRQGNIQQMKTSVYWIYNTLNLSITDLEGIWIVQNTLSVCINMDEILVTPIPIIIPTTNEVILEIQKWWGNLVEPSLACYKFFWRYRNSQKPWSYEKKTSAYFQVENWLHGGAFEAHIGKRNKRHSHSSKIQLHDQILDSFCRWYVSPPTQTANKWPAHDSKYSTKK